MNYLLGLFKALSVISVAAFLSACFGPPIIPVQELPTTGRSTNERVVRPGDTLYNIAWESNIDYHRVAEWNNINPPYVIKPGQRIRLIPPPTPKQRDATPSAVPEQNSNTNTQSLEVVTTTASKQNTQTQQNTKTTRANTTTTAKTPVKLPTKVAAWNWPAKGKVIQRFSPTNNKGIDIAGRDGSPIHAAADGAVVYAGNGLRGYGQLIILKHSEQYLSAYAHQRRILVREGDAVNRGQVIAEMGNTGTDKTKLHFEIRHNGKPVDPMGFLPRNRS